MKRVTDEEAATEGIEHRGPLCGDPTCEICPTQDAIDAWHQRLEDNVRGTITKGIIAMKRVTDEEAATEGIDSKESVREALISWRESALAMPNPPMDGIVLLSHAIWWLSHDAMKDETELQPNCCPICHQFLARPPSRMGRVWCSTCEEYIIPIAIEIVVNNT